ncbi:MAG: hypothetical protein JNJ58_11355 [Chitinophagaceae bacterium]|nr:hypothetical protein [Chitinophagaceae bacterium]
MKKITFALLAMSFFAVSCDKVKTDPPATTTANNSATTPNFATGDGFLVAVKTVTKTTVAGFPIETILGTGVAGFGNLSAATYNDAGTITLNTKSLGKQSNNSYVYIPTATDITGIDFSSSINWSVGGAGSVPAFTHSATAQGMPSAGDISGSFTTISSGSDFTLSTTAVPSGADSVYFQVAGPNAVIVKRMSGTSSAATFTAAELATLGKGSGSVVVAPWNYSSATYSGKLIHVVNELALSRVVEIQ